MKGISTEALRAELAAREAAEKCSTVDWNRKLRHALEKAPELIDLLAPRHCRTSCSDEDPRNNGFLSDHPPRCNRCGLLAIKVGFLPPYRISIDWVPNKEGGQ